MDNLAWTVRPHSSVPYALDEPIEPAGLVLTAPGGVSHPYDLNVLGEGRGLTYENFIYIAFTGNRRLVDFLLIQINETIRIFQEHLKPMRISGREKPIHWTWKLINWF